MTDKKIFLLDGHSLAHRSFYALPLLTNSEGEYTNAVFGFCRMLFKLLDEEDPDLITVAFDKEAPTFRHKEYEEYKSTRKKMPDELRPQIDLIKKVLAALNIPIFELEGYEADDIIGTLAIEAEEKGMNVKIISGDRDTLQLVSDRTNVLYTRKGISDLVEYDLEEVKEEYELAPEQLIDMKGLMGDNSDNIPGVPGIGKKTAIKLLKEFSSLENVLNNINRVSGKKRKENLRKFSEQAEMSKRLGRIMLDVPLEIDLEDCKREEADQEKIVDLFERLEFGSLLDRFQENPEINSQDINIKKLSKKDDLEELLNKIKEKGIFAFNIILDDFSFPVRANMKSFLFTVDREKVYLLNDEDFLIEVFADVFRDPEIEKYLLHAKESIIYLQKNGVELKNLTFDPLLAIYLQNPSKKLVSLSELLENELNIKLEEDITLEKTTALMLTNIIELKEKFFTDLQENKLLELYQEMEIPLIKVLAEMEINGIKVDLDFLNELSKKYEEKLKTITEKVHQLAGEEFNLNSPQQLSEILFEKLDLPVIKKTKTGYSTGISVLEELEDKHEIIPLIMEYRQWSKFKSTYVDALPPLINEKTGRIHTSFNQMVTATGRLSSTEPNLQNIPIRTEEGREIRKAFIPENDDWILLAADYSQIELRVLAHICDDQGLQEAFNKGRDIHTETAAEIFEVEADDVTENMRREAKVINFGIAYGMSAYGLSDDLDISRKEAEEYINRYFDRFSGVKNYMEDIIFKAGEQGYVTTIFNRRRQIPEIKSRNFHRRSFAERTAINTPIQGSAADIMKIAMIDLYNSLKDKNSIARILLQVHDELVLEVKKEVLADIARTVKENMESAVELEVPLIVDLQVGDNWKEKRDYHLEGEGNA